jgi:hypothetical protein
MANESILNKLDLIAEKTSSIIDENKKIKQQNGEANLLIKKLKKINEVQKNSLEILEQKNKLTNIASIVSTLSDEDKIGLKKTLSIQIKEIDKCLKLLKN